MPVNSASLEMGRSLLSAATPDDPSVKWRTNTSQADAAEQPQVLPPPTCQIVGNDHILAEEAPLSAIQQGEPSSQRRRETKRKVSRGSCPGKQQHDGGKGWKEKLPAWQATLRVQGVWRSRDLPAWQASLRVQGVWRQQHLPAW